MSNNQALYQASAGLTCTSLASLATGGLVAGAASVAFDNSSGQYLDLIASGAIKVGTGLTQFTFIEVWLISQLADGTWPGTFAGTDAAVTVASRGTLTSYGVRLALISVDLATASQIYYFSQSIAALFGIVPPKKFQLFVTHNTAVNLAASGSVLTLTPVNITTI